MAASSPDDCAVSVVTAYELFTGVGKCREPAQERAKVTKLITTVRLVAFDRTAAEHAALVRMDLERTGRVCGPYDLLLAGHALCLGLTLATNNVREFSRVGGLTVEDWLA